MQIQFYNSLSKRVEPFQPLEAGVVRMYSCGPTVYDFAHVGNFRSFLFADLLRRFLEAAGNEVIQVMNITDVGHMTDDDLADGGGQDKMELAAKRFKEAKKAGTAPPGSIDNPDDPYQIARFYTQAFLEDGRKLGMKVAHEYPQRVFHATDHIQDMLDMIQALIDRGHAYVAPDGVVYFSVESFPAYGQLSGNTLEMLREGSGGRISHENQANKRHPADFMLWKPDQKHIMRWPSDWGEGYPGWHIECSAMARKRLERDVIDIHTGGEDLIFPHHECEIAQSCGATGESSFARFWIHARFLLVEGEKMSKRKGNFYTVRDVLEGRATGRVVHPAVLRLELTKSHYRINMNFTAKGLQDSARAVRRIGEFKEACRESAQGQRAAVDNSHPVLREFFAALADDLNIAGALGVVLPWIQQKPDDPAEALGVLARMDQVLGLTELSTETAGPDVAEDRDPQIVRWCRELDEARASKDFQRADEFRKRLIEAGFEVRTTKDGTVVHRPLA